MLDVLVATLDARRIPGGLAYAPPHRYYVSVETPWGRAANALLDAGDGDALFLDDDVTLIPSTLALLEPYRDRADVFGFTLMSPLGADTWEIVSAGYGITSGGTLMRWSVRDALTPRAVAHVTASCLFINARARQSGVRFPAWDGIHYEDVAYTLDCWLHGLRVAYLPGVVEHPLTPLGTGATKGQADDAVSRRAQNERRLRAWMDEHAVAAAIADGRIPGRPQQL